MRLSAVCPSVVADSRARAEEAEAALFMEAALGRPESVACVSSASLSTVGTLCGTSVTENPWDNDLDRASVLGSVSNANLTPSKSVVESVEDGHVHLAHGGWDVESRLKQLDGLLKSGYDGSVTTAVCDEGFIEAARLASGPPSKFQRVTPVPSMFVGQKAVMMAQLAEGSFNIPDVLQPERQPFVDTRPSSRYISGMPSACVRDGSGKVIQWPWETPNENFGGAGYALPKCSTAPHRTDALRLLGMNASIASGNMGRDQTGVKHWRAFCEAEGVSPDRPIDPSSPLWVKLEEEMLAMQFCCAMVQDRGVQVSTAACYFGQVQGWHAKEHGIKLAAGVKLCRLPAMLKGLRRVLGEAPRTVRRGIAPAALRKAMDLTLDPRVPAHANIRAALALALQGLLRSAEYACDAGVKFNPLKHLTRADLHECTEERLVLMMLPCKNMRHLSGKTCPLVIGSGGELIDAVAEVRNMLAVDPVHPDRAASTPLFRVPESNEPLRTNMLHGLIRNMMAAIGETDPSQFGTHSLRIGGATALFAAGADETTIRTMGRWSSDCYRLYVRACFESTLKWSRLAGSAQVSDLAGEFDEVDFY